MNTKQISEDQIRKVINDIEYITKLGDNMISIQLNRKSERLTLYRLDIEYIEKLGLRLWNIDFRNKILTFDIVKN